MYLIQSTEVIKETIPSEKFYEIKAFVLYFQMPISPIYHPSRMDTSANLYSNQHMSNSTKMLPLQANSSFYIKSSAKIQLC